MDLANQMAAYTGMPVMVVKILSGILISAALLTATYQFGCRYMGMAPMLTKEERQLREQKARLKLEKSERRRQLFKKAMRL